jgi:DNA-binding winged helix-turn-helix (wHTH) protein
MAMKASVGLEDRIDRIPIAELMSDARLLEWTIPPLSSASRTRQERVRPEPDNYQIALVSFQDGQDPSDGNPQRAGTGGRLFLLPLTWRQLVTRARGAFGHSNLLQKDRIVRFGRVSINLMSMDVRRSACPVNLTAMEFKVLKFFVSNPNRVITRDQMLNEVWGYHNYPCTRTVDNHVLKLRQKLEPNPGDPIHFRTVHGIGYKFIPEVN